MARDKGLSGWWRELRRAITWHRRPLAAGLAACAVAATIGALQPAPPGTVPVLAAARDLGGGTPLRHGDVTTVRLSSTLVPAGALRPGAETAGLTLASPARRGETLTDARIIGPGLLRDAGVDGSELVAVPVRLADAQAARLVRVGDRVDVLAAEARPEHTGTEGTAQSLAHAVRVLAVPRPVEDRAFVAAQVSEGALVVLATTPEVAAVLARAAVTSRISVTIRDG